MTRKITARAVRRAKRFCSALFTPCDKCGGDIIDNVVYLAEWSSKPSGLCVDCENDALGSEYGQIFTGDIYQNEK
jgi:hypothetical protein